MTNIEFEVLISNIIEEDYVHINEIINNKTVLRTYYYKNVENIYEELILTNYKIEIEYNKDTYKLYSINTIII